MDRASDPRQRIGALGASRARPRRRPVRTRSAGPASPRTAREPRRRGIVRYPTTRRSSAADRRRAASFDRTGARGRVGPASPRGTVETIGRGGGKKARVLKGEARRPFRRRGNEMFGPHPMIDVALDPRRGRGRGRHPIGALGTVARRAGGLGRRRGEFGQGGDVTAEALKISDVQLRRGVTSACRPRGMLAGDDHQGRDQPAVGVPTGDVHRRFRRGSEARFPGRLGKGAAK